MIPPLSISLTCQTVPSRTDCVVAGGAPFLVMGVFSKQPVSAMTAPASNAALALIFVIRFPGSFRQFTDIAGRSNATLSPAWTAGDETLIHSPPLRRSTGICRENGLAFLDGLQNLDLIDVHRIDFQRVFGKHHHVRQLAGLERALAMLLEVLPGSVLCHRP